MYQNGCYTGLPNVSATVCISIRSQSRSELSADLTGVSDGGVNFVYFGKPFMNLRVPDGSK